MYPVTSEVQNTKILTVYISPWSVADCYVYTSILSSAACPQISWQSAHRSYWAMLTVHVFTCLLSLDRSLIWSYCLGLKFCVFYMSKWQKLVPFAHMCMCVYVCVDLLSFRSVGTERYLDEGTKNSDLYKVFERIFAVWQNIGYLQAAKKWRGSVRLLAALKGNQLHITAVLRVPSANTMLREVLRIPAIAEGAKVWIRVQQS